MTMPPMKVTQSAAPQAVAKQRTCASLAAATPAPERPEPPRSASGAKRTPAARKDTAVRNRAAHPIVPPTPTRLGFGFREIGWRKKKKRANLCAWK